MLLALVFTTALTAAPESMYRVAIFDEPSLPVEGIATPAAFFERVLAEEGAVVTRLNAAHMSNAPSRHCEESPTKQSPSLDLNAVDLLVIPTGASFPLEAKDALLTFLQGGGDLLCTGGYAFDRLWVKRADQWIPYAEQLAQDKAQARDPQKSLIPNGGFENGADGWTSPGAGTCSVVRQEGCSGRVCGQVANATPGGGGCWETALPIQPGGSFLIGARMKAANVEGSGIAHLSVYQFSADGALVQFIDFVQLRQAAEWNHYETHVDIAPKASRVVFRAGFYLATGTLWVDDVTCAPLPHEELINAHYGRPEDGLTLAPLQLTLFSPDQRFRGQSLSASPDSPLPADWASLGAVEGFEATAQLQQVARWAPLVEARDAWGRFSGEAGALVHHFGGPFAGSSWALFGVANRDLFGDAAGERLLREVVSRLRAGVFIQSSTTDCAIYNRGEAVHVTAEIRNDSREPRWVQLDIELRSADGAAVLPAVPSQSVECAAHSTRRIEFAWPVGPDVPDAVQIRAILKLGEMVADCHSAGFCVYDEGVVARGARIRYDENAFTLGRADGSRRRFCLFGTDTYGNIFSPPNDSSWTWLLDMQAMRDNGLHMLENLQYTPKDYLFTPAQLRQLDAMVQLSQRFGLPYIAGLLIGQDVAVGDEELGRQAEFCRQFAARFKQVPGLIYYLNGDFQLHLTDTPDVRRLWNDFLRRRYANDEALKDAWTQSPPEGPLGQIPVTDPPPRGWYDARKRDVTAFKVELLKRWLTALSSAIRQEDAQHPITGEYYQLPYNGIDLRLSVSEMDAGNFGYFNPPQSDLARLPATIKWNDMRRSGKGIGIGEFGVKTHDAWSPERGGAHYHAQRTDEQRDRLFWSVAHAALAMGVNKIQNWCWRDDPDRVFPWGIAWSNPLRPKPVLKLYGNLALVAEHVEPTYVPADVVLAMPDNWRLGAPEPFGNDALMNAIECLLATGVPFDAVNESELGDLVQKPPRLVVMPFAYALGDDTVQRLRALAEAGAWVYLSGDCSIDVRGKRDASRLESLAGVRYSSEGAGPSGLPVPVVTPVDAAPLDNPCGLTIYRCTRAKGTVVWTPAPWEHFAGRDAFVAQPELTMDPSSNFYLTLLHLAGLEAPLQVEATKGVWRGMLTPCGSNRLVSLFPRSQTPEGGVRAKAQGFALEFGPNLTMPGLALLDTEGRPLLATGNGELRINGVPLVRGDGAWIVCGLDNAPLPMARTLAVSSTTTGTLWWRSEATELAAWLAERQGGGTRMIAPVPLARVEDGWRLETAPNELYLVARAGQAQ